MKPILFLLTAALFVSCVSHPVQESSPPDGAFVVDSNMGGKEGFYTVEKGQKWIYEARTTVPKDGERVLRIRQSWFEASNDLSWSRSLLARILNYQVQWRGTVEYQGQTKNLEIGFVLRSRVEPGRRTTLIPITFHNLVISFDGETLTTTDRLPEELQAPYELFQLSGLPVTLAAVHGPFYQKPVPEQKIRLVTELTRSDLQLALTDPSGRMISGKTVSGWGHTDDLVWGAAANHVLSQMLVQMFN